VGPTILRSRPWESCANSVGFPSGHAAYAAAAIVYGTLWLMYRGNF